MVRINPKPFGNKVKYELKYIVPKIVRVFLRTKLQIALSKVKLRVNGFTTRCFSNENTGEKMWIFKQIKCCM